MAHIGFEILAVAKKYGAIPTDDRHFADDCAKLVEEKFTSTNKQSTPCSICGKDASYGVRICFDCNDRMG